MIKIGTLPKTFFLVFLFNILFPGVILEVSKHSVNGKMDGVAGEFIREIAAQDNYSPATGDGTDWWLLWENREGTCFADLNCILYSGSTVKVWLRWVVTETGKARETVRRTKVGLPTADLNDWDYTLSLFEIDCLNRMARLVDNISYDREENPIRNPIVAFWTNAWKKEWKRIPPRTEIGNLFKQLCR